MHDLSSGTDLHTLVPMFIAVEPRDPRGEGRLSDEAIEHVPAATLSEVAGVLSQLGIPADLLDGAVLGAPGWVVARTVGWSDGRLVRWAPDENPAEGPYPTLSSDDVAVYLARSLDVACRISSDLEIPGETPGDDAVGLVIEKRSGAVVGAMRSTDVPRLAYRTGSSLWFAQIDGVSIIAGLEPDADLEAVVTAPSSTPTIGLERNGPWRRMGLVKGSVFVTAHEWGPQWYRVDPSGGTDTNSTVLTLVDDYFDVPTADPADLAAHYDLDSDQLRDLAELLDDVDSDDPFTALMRLLGLPVAAAEVAEGWLPPADLPQVRLVEAQPFVQAWWSSVTTVPTEDGILNDMQRLWIHRPSAYWVLTIAEVALCAGGAALALRVGAPAEVRRGLPRWRRRTGRLFTGLAVVHLLDLAVPSRWRGMRP